MAEILMVTVGCLVSGCCFGVFGVGIGKGHKADGTDGFLLFLGLLGFALIYIA